MSAIEDRRQDLRSGRTRELGMLGRYQLLEPIASGGMGAVYLARLVGDGGFEKFVALKVLLPDISGNQRFVAMFLDEARIAARFSHPNVCDVYELGEADGRHFIAMQYLRGVPLTDVMRTQGGDRARQIRMIASLIIQACEGLHHAHELKDASGRDLVVVHRDVSPPNLFVTSDGVLKVLDFGIAKARDIESKTRRSEVKGKQAYLSPEQLVGSDLDRRSDIFSLAIVLYEGITTTRLFPRDTDYLIAKAILEEPVEPPSRRRPEVPAALSEVVMKALARRRDDRYATAREFGVAIASALGPQGPMVPAEVAEHLQAGFGQRLAKNDARLEKATATARRIADSAASTLGGRRFPSRARGSRLGWWLAGLLVVALAGAAAFWWIRVQAKSPQASSSGTTSPPALDSGAIVLALGVDGGTEAPLDAGVAAAIDASASKVTDKRPGTISIDSTPYATIYVDGRRFGLTPLIGHPVKPGTRRIEAVLASGKTKRFRIRVRPGKAARAKRLSW